MTFIKHALNTNNALLRAMDHILGE